MSGIGPGSTKAQDWLPTLTHEQALQCLEDVTDWQWRHDDTFTPSYSWFGSHPNKKEDVQVANSAAELWAKVLVELTETVIVVKE